MSVISEAKAKIGAVTLNKGKLPELLGKRLQEMFDKIEMLLHPKSPFMEYFRNLLVKHAQDYMKFSAPSGRKYVYWDAATKKPLYSWTASNPFETPAILKDHTLIDSIEAKAFYESSRDALTSIVLGVFKKTLGGVYPTVAYRPADKRKKEGGNPRPDRLIVKQGGTKTPVDEYAKYLELGTKRMLPHPFLDGAFEYALSQCKDEFRDFLKKALLSGMDRKKLPVYFKIYVRNK